MNTDAPLPPENFAPEPSAPAPDAHHEEISALKDKLLRALAETENVKKRGQREVEEMAKYAKMAWALDLLPIADNLHRALQNIPMDAMEHEAVKSIVTGVALTEKELHKVFEKHHVQAVKSLGEKFDHNVHQAMLEVEHETHGVVVEVLQEGYKLHDRLLRPAMVAVSK